MTTLVEELEVLLLPFEEVQVVVALTKLRPPKLENEKARAKPDEVAVEQLSVSLAACAGIVKSAAASNKAANAAPDLIEREVSVMEIKKKKSRLFFARNQK